MQFTGHDIIGDVHGHASKLEALLANMGYRHEGGVWRHPTRLALFVGDFVDRGPRQLDAIQIVRGMVRAGSAKACMGNHELNAIGWITPSQSRPGAMLRRRDGPKGASNHHHHKAFLEQVGADGEQHRELVDWFMTLPLWIELPELCMAHACWHPQAMAVAKQRLGPLGILTPDVLEEALQEPEHAEPGAPMSLFHAIELICKGVEIELPNGVKYKDQDGFERSRVRSRWWDQSADTFQKTAMLSSSLRATLPDEPIPEEAKVPLPLGKPIFFGHYWMSGAPAPVALSAACVDYSAAKAGPLVAYRHDGEFELSASKFASSEQAPAPSRSAPK